MSARVLFMGYHALGASCLRVLLEEKNARVVSLFTHADDPHENRWFETPAPLAESHGIPVHVLDSLKGEGSARLVRDLAPDLIVSVYYRMLIPASILTIPRLGAVNLHGSLLPRYRGRVPINWAIIHGETETGVTLHFMVKRPDAGDIIDQAHVAIDFEDTAHSLFLKMIPIGTELFRRNLPALLSGRSPRRAQDETQATYFGGRRPEDGHIDWTKPARRIYDLVRAVTHPYPGAFARLPASGQLMIWRALPEPEAVPADACAPGTLFSSGPNVYVACGERTRLRLLEVEERTEAGREAPVQTAADWYRARVKDVRRLE